MFSDLRASQPPPPLMNLKSFPICYYFPSSNRRPHSEKFIFLCSTRCLCCGFTCLYDQFFDEKRWRRVSLRKSSIIVNQTSDILKSQFFLILIHNSRTTPLVGIYCSRYSLPSALCPIRCRKAQPRETAGKSFSCISSGAVARRT